MKTYRTAQGDAWDIIALKMYPNLGAEKLMHVLIEANPAHRATVIFGANVTLKVPDVSVPVVQNLPPWKRGG